MDNTPRDKDNIGKNTGCLLFILFYNHTLSMIIALYIYILCSTVILLDEIMVVFEYECKMHSKCAIYITWYTVL